MKKIKIIYWTLTGVFTAMMTMSAIQYFTAPEMVSTFEHLGFPDYFRMELGIAKVIGALVLILPMVSSKLKEWAYAGFGIVLISASVAHIAVGDSVVNAIVPVVFLGILSVSNVFYYKLKLQNK